MLSPSNYMPITGTFVSCLPGDTGINNWGLRQWEEEFRLYKRLGIDTIVIIRSEVQMDGVPSSGFDPRTTTWPEDLNLISMFFRLCEENGLKLYLGGCENVDNLRLGHWKREIDDNRVFYEKALETFGDYRCFHGIYYSIEALPWHFNFCDVAVGTAEVLHKLAPRKKKLFSPTFYGVTGANNGHYSLNDFESLWGDMLAGMSGRLDYCAWQDKYFMPHSRMGQILPTPLDDWYRSAKKITEAAGVEFWANVETFQRFSTMPLSHRYDCRQIDYRCLAAKLQSAARFAAKAITFEFSTCMSPNAEWGSSHFLLERYLEMVGLDVELSGNRTERSRQSAVKPSRPAIEALAAELEEPVAAK